MRGTSVCPQDTHAIFLDTEPGFGWDDRFRFGVDAPGEESVDDPVRLCGALRLAEVRSPWAGLIDFIEYGDAAYRAELKYRAKKQMRDAQPATLSGGHLLGVDAEGILALELPEMGSTTLNCFMGFDRLTIFARIWRFVSTLADPPAQLRRLAQNA